MSTCLIVSLKYAPGLMKFFTLLGDQLDQRGHSVRYLLTREYDAMMDPRHRVDYFVTRSGNRQITVDWLKSLPDLIHKPPLVSADFALFYNFHPLNHNLVRALAKHRPGSVRCVYLHEPFVAEKIGHFGWGRGSLLVLMELLQKRILRSCTHVILPSANAADQFQQLMPDFHGQQHIGPLLVPDVPGKEREREFISLVGRAENLNKGLTLFAKLLEATHSNDNLRYRLLTTTPLHRWYEQLSSHAREHLVFEQPEHLSDADIHAALQQSRAVLLLHRHLSQSGVLPVAFMNGTPIVARDLPGFRQYLKDRRHGRLVPVQSDPRQWVEAIRWVSEHAEEMSADCRKVYETTFAPRNWQRNYDWLTRELSGAAG